MEEEKKLITVSQSRQKRRGQRLPWRCGIKGIKVRFKGERARTPSLAQIHSPFRSISLLSGQSQADAGCNYAVICGPWKLFNRFLLDFLVISV